jgi:hypothetical protein
MVVLARILLIAWASCLPTGCDESLPPRDDPQGFLEASFTEAGGSILLEKDLTPSAGFLGGYFVGVKNLYDEVLQAEEDVEILVLYYVEGEDSVPGIFAGDRTALVDQTMLERDSFLTILPGETARFFVGIDHDTERLWTNGDLTFHRMPAQPFDITWLESDTIALLCTGTAKFFKGVAGYEFGGRLEIVYQILVDSPVFPVDSLQARYDPDSGQVIVTWQTPFEYQTVGFVVERAPLQGRFIPADNMLIHGNAPDSLRNHYQWIEPLARERGTWFYRLQRWYNFIFAQAQIEPTDSVSVVIP